MFIYLREGRCQYGVMYYASDAIEYDRTKPGLSNAALHMTQYANSIEIDPFLRLRLTCAFPVQVEEQARCFCCSRMACPSSGSQSPTACSVRIQ